MVCAMMAPSTTKSVACLLLLLVFTAGSQSSAPERTEAPHRLLGKQCTLDTEEYICGVLACLPNQDNRDYSCQPCKFDVDCHGPEQKCEFRDEQSQCVHKELLWELSFRDYFGTIVIFIGGALAAGGGIGGGGVFVPILIFIFAFREHSAVALSSAMVFGGSIANFGMNVFKKHPFAHRPLIDYDVVMVMEPLTLAGAVIGVFLNTIFPDYIILVLLVVVLSLTTWRSGRKGIQTWRRESQPAQQIIVENERREENDHHNPPAVLRSMDEDGEEEEGESLISRERQFEPDIQEIIDMEATQLPAGKVFVTFLCWLAILISGLMKGGRHQLSFLHLPTCSWYFWVATATSMLFTVIVTAYYTVGLLRRHTKKVECGYPFARGDVKWTKRNALVYPSLYAAAGMMAGTLGIGGGTIKGPLMLEMGMIPETTAATAAFMIMFTSSSTTIQFLLVGTLREDYAAYLAVVGFFSTILGQVVITWLVKRFRKSAYIIFSIVFVIGTSTILLSINGGLKVYHEFKMGSPQGFHFDKVCA